ncbi:hypothetical protein BC828DRAFT_378167 [Blastocladiella britannica]|nr:hypothetical protein BC828DRAFT_378167 [Blastocladiella britannica]
MAPTAFPVTSTPNVERVDKIGTSSSATAAANSTVVGCAIGTKHSSHVCTGDTCGGAGGCSVDAMALAELPGESHDISAELQAALLATFSFEARTALTNILGMADMLLGDASHPPSRQGSWPTEVAATTPAAATTQQIADDLATAARDGPAASTAFALACMSASGVHAPATAATVTTLASATPAMLRLPGTPFNGGGGGDMTLSALQTIKLSSGQMLRSLETMKLLSGLMANQVHAHWEPVAISDVMERTQSGIVSVARPLGVSFVASASSPLLSNPHQRYRSDAFHIQHLLDHLAESFVHLTPRGGKVTVDMTIAECPLALGRVYLRTFITTTAPESQATLTNLLECETVQASAAAVPGFFKMAQTGSDHDRRGVSAIKVPRAAACMMVAKKIAQVLLGKVRVGTPEEVAARVPRGPNGEPSGAVLVIDLSRVLPLTRILAGDRAISSVGGGDSDADVDDAFLDASASSQAAVTIGAATEKLIQEQWTKDVAAAKVAAEQMEVERVAQAEAAAIAAAAVPLAAPVSRVWVCPPDHEIVSSKTRAERALLVVEDNIINQKILSQLLSKLGYSNVTFAADGADALFRYRDRRTDGPDRHCYFDLILLDDGLPTLSGSDMSVAVRRGGDRTQVIVSCSASTKFVANAEVRRAYGYDDAIVKPVALDALKRLIEKWSARGDARRIRHERRRLMEEARAKGLEVVEQPEEGGVAMD